MFSTNNAFLSGLKILNFQVQMNNAFLSGLKILNFQLQVEKLIKELPSVPADWSNGDVSYMEKAHLSNGISFQHAENGTNLRETQSMLLERIASEMNRLKFYIAHAQVYIAPTLMFDFTN